MGFGAAARRQDKETGCPAAAGRRSVSVATARVPAGVRIYAIGDIHGRDDLLEALLETVRDDAARFPCRRRVLVYLGDFIDRGPDSAAVIGRLAAGPPPGFKAIHLIGNHETTMRAFLDDARFGPAWVSFGGAATLASYGVTPPGGLASREVWQELRVRLARALPGSHRRFLGGLAHHWRCGDYLFVHAGIRPGIGLDQQDEDDLIWIREEFLRSDDDFGAVVVHGHTIRWEPEVRDNRIGIDTGAFTTGRLTCAVLEGFGTHRFLET